jgi:hypothetical protein
LKSADSNNPAGDFDFNGARQKNRTKNSVADVQPDWQPLVN